MIPSNQILSSFTKNQKTYHYVDLTGFCARAGKSIQQLPFALRILLEGCLRNAGKNGFHSDASRANLNWSPALDHQDHAVPFLPARVLMQDFTGLPVLNDLTALRAAIQRDGKDAKRVNPLIPSDLVIDHSLQVQAYARPDARAINEIGRASCRERV